MGRVKDMMIDQMERGDWPWDDGEWRRDELTIEADRYDDEQRWMAEMDRIERRELLLALNQLRKFQALAKRKTASRWTMRLIERSIEECKSQVLALGGTLPEEESSF